MSVNIIIGAQWGDEGKGKIIDLLSADAEFVVRVQGGANAGHTVIIGDTRYALHLIPSGILRPEPKCIIAQGVVIDPEVLLEEMELLRMHNIKLDGRFFISDRAHVVMPYHKLIEASGLRTPNRDIDTTKRGIWPAYADKVSRIGIRMGDFLNLPFLEDKIRHNVKQFNTVFGDSSKIKEDLSVDHVVKVYKEYAVKLAPYIADTLTILHDGLDRKANVFIEGAQGTMLDVDMGVYPNVTSSNTTAGGACTGSGIPPTSIDKVLGIAKAYITRVGVGPVPTDLTDATGDLIRERGKEYGTTTGRPRRCGWFDAVLTRFACKVNGISEIVLMKLDILDVFPTIKICDYYEYKGKRLDTIPADVTFFSEVKPHYQELPGWQVPTSDIKKYSDLPQNAKAYIQRIQELIGVRIGIVSVGPERNQTVIKANEAN